MPRERHDGMRVVAGIDQVPHTAASEVVDNPPRESDRRTRSLPHLAEVADPSPMLVEHVRAIEATRGESPLDDRRERAGVHREHARAIVLAVFGSEPDEPAARS